METNTEKPIKDNVELIDKILGIAEKASAILILVIFVSIVFSLFSSWIMDLGRDYSIVFLTAMLSIIPAGLLTFLIQVWRIVRRKKALTLFNGLMLAAS